MRRFPLIVFSETLFEISGHSHVALLLRRKTLNKVHVIHWPSFAEASEGENHLATIPTAVYGFVLLMAAIAYYVLERAIIAKEGRDSLLAQAIGRDWKGKLSPVLYFAAIPLAFVSPWIASGIYVFVALLWLIPDPRIERKLEEREE